MPKQSDQKKRLLVLKDIFEQETDEAHGLTTKRLLEILENNGMKVDRKTLYSDIETLQFYGLDIAHEKREKTYRLLTRNFELSEIKLMIDCMQSSKFLSEKRTESLIRKLQGLCSRYEAEQLRRQVTVANRVKNLNKEIYANVDTIHRAIANNHQISFLYFDYDIGMKRAYRMGKQKYERSPFELLYMDENYYLLAYDTKWEKIVTYRVDRMVEVQELRSQRAGHTTYAQIDRAQYQKSVFNMFMGKMQKVTMVFHYELMNTFVDKFGTDIMVMEEDDTHYRVTVLVSVSPQFFGWIFGLGDKVRIVGPDNVIDMMGAALSHVAKYYPVNQP